MPKYSALTDVAIRKLAPPQQGTVTHWDGVVDGLGLRMSPGGARTFIVLVGSGKRQKLGRYPDLSLSAARTEARRVKAEVTLGRYQPATVTFEQAKTEYLRDCEKKNKPRTVQDYRRLLKHFPFGPKRLDLIRRLDITRKLDAIAAPSEASHARVAIKAYFSWCVAKGYLENSPAEALKGAQTLSSRDRVLGVAELKTLLKTASVASEPFEQIVHLLVLTGQRRGEIAALQWDWIDPDERLITLPSAITKNKRVHAFPYGDEVEGVLDRAARLHDTYLFPATRTHVKGRPTTIFNGWGKAKELFDAKLDGVAPYTLHDLRRTYSTSMASIGVSQVVVEKLLNHISGGTQSPIAQVYNRHSYLQEMRQAVQEYESFIRSLM